ncbi:2-hydroxyacyl-CoA dehydratase [Mediterranea massiliensis]|uniref:2-hydroxyacyl-CoA dehydratase n=1 Tax=Mediterranea massiliensis TaxID=1841865 RepID=A0ABS2E0W0_9BACT|nr:acyl-CoA dehydratase activase-related protein [Mediterranea massiliensis]MBM6735237.1 2-hydroxyacyl-CoA dehydratase [Mediterranea massiliensis]
MRKIGIDVGSTTVKVVALDEQGSVCFSRYKRHHARAREVVADMLGELLQEQGDVEACACITGSVGMGMSERHSIPFIQEVVAATKAIQQDYPQVASMIDIGGEDAKIVFFEHGEAADLRMNGNCAGGTGAFIDQMAVILGTDVDELNRLALKAGRIYPIASRCGVFCKTDIQNLVARNVSREDIAASIFHAVAVQTVMTLAHGWDIKAPVLFCGGPLTFIPALRKAFAEYLHLREDEMVLPANGTLLPATGAALSRGEENETFKLSALIARLSEASAAADHPCGLKPVFSSAGDYAVWEKRISSHRIGRASLREGVQDVFLGIDSGSTTTKIVVIDSDGNLLFTYYKPNGGHAIETVANGLALLKDRCREQGAVLNIKGSCSTGYGEDLIKAAFQLDAGIVETIAHYVAAHYLDRDVSFILDIGGQDMKAIFVDNGIINRIEINEACSSGCGSFIETFANTLGYTARDFASAACRSARPCDLGSRCTVFMNSKVKQVLREGATVDDIAAGLAYSVVKNCLYRVLKLKDVSELGRHIVVQGGTMRNDAVVRALELLTGAEVIRCDIPELMGAFGCALYARRYGKREVSLDDILSQADYSTHELHCRGCNNQCQVFRYRFANGKDYYSGNRCEKVFTNGAKEEPGANAYHFKNDLLFGRAARQVEHPVLTLGISRSLNMYENFPFWHTLFTACGIQVCLSDDSDFKAYERSARMVMSDNICFPAKLVHAHVQNLMDRGVDRIFLPFVIFERKGNEQNSYNCPVVTGYSEVIKSVQGTGIPIDSPAISFKDPKLLYRQCLNYLKGLGVGEAVVKEAFARAMDEQEAFGHSLAEHDRHLLEESRRKGRRTVLLAGRPYHTDMLIQHKISDILAEMGIDVITDDIVRDQATQVEGDVHFLPQWSYPNRILKAAQWCAAQGSDVQFVEMTSFGCGPDAFLVDEVRDILIRSGKPFTLLKLDDINNVGSMKLRVRSLIESMKLSGERQVPPRKREEGGEAASVSYHDLRTKKILVPYFTPFISPLIPAFMRLAGYDVDNLPLSNMDSCEWGLKYANNEVCYPATLIVGDVVKAFKSGKYDPKQTIVAMTQTGGQCRASNYISLIKKALEEAGYPSVPVISLTFGSSLDSRQPSFRVNWVKMLPVALRTILYSDCISKFYYAAVVREKEAGQAARLRDRYLQEGEELILKYQTKDLLGRLSEAARQFNDICRELDCPKVGVVGEIFLKFNPFAQKNVIEWLTEQGIEVVPSVLADFFMQNFVNRKVRVESCIQQQFLPDFVYKLAYKMVGCQIEKFNKVGSEFRYFNPFKDIFEEADEAKKVISLNAQFGEGWLLPAEILSYARQGIYNVVSLQPFGCIANHIVSKGIEKRIKSVIPELNMLSLDFDSGVSDVNITNRLLLFIDHLK